MASHLVENKPPSAIYQKALEIFSLARHISTYLTYDLSPLESNGKEDPLVYFSGDIVQQSISLAPQILKAEREPYAEGKHKYAAAVARLSNLLYKTCERLEHSHSNGRDFLPLLRKELKKFKKLQRTWQLTL